MTKEMQQTFLKDLFETPLFVGAAIQESIVVSPILIFKSNLKIKIRNRDKQMMNRSYDKLPIRSYDKRGVYRCGWVHTTQDAEDNDFEARMNNR
jgi:hypothetical protein